VFLAALCFASARLQPASRASFAPTNRNIHSSNMALEGRWHKITQSEDDANYPGARSSHSVVGVGAAAYVFGGEFEPRTPISNETYKYHHDRRAFERCAMIGGAGGGVCAWL